MNFFCALFFAERMKRKNKQIHAAVVIPDLSGFTSNGNESSIFVSEANAKIVIESRLVLMQHLFCATKTPWQSFHNENTKCEIGLGSPICCLANRKLHNIHLIYIK